MTWQFQGADCVDFVKFLEVSIALIDLTSRFCDINFKLSFGCEAFECSSVLC